MGRGHLRSVLVLALPALLASTACQAPAPADPDATPDVTSTASAGDSAGDSAKNGGNGSEINSVPAGHVQRYRSSTWLVDTSALPEADKAPRPVSDLDSGPAPEPAYPALIGEPVSTAYGFIDDQDREFTSHFDTEGKLSWQGVRTEGGTWVEINGVRTVVSPQLRESHMATLTERRFDLEQATNLSGRSPPAGVIVYLNDALGRAQVRTASTNEGVWWGWYTPQGRLLAEEIRVWAPGLDAFAVTATHYALPSPGSLTTALATHDTSWLSPALDAAPFSLAEGEDLETEKPTEPADPTTDDGTPELTSTMLAGTYGFVVPGGGMTLAGALGGFGGKPGIVTAEYAASMQVALIGAAGFVALGQAIECVLVEPCARPVATLRNDNLRLAQIAAVSAAIALGVEVLEEECLGLEEEMAALQGRRTTRSAGRALNEDEACVLAWHCKAAEAAGLTRGQPCRGLDIFITGVTHPAATAHVVDAVTADQLPIVLTRTWDTHSRHWLVGHPGCSLKLPWQDCDEYPFASTVEGGEDNRVSVRPVLRRHNRGQGSTLGRMYTRCGTGQATVDAVGEVSQDGSISLSVVRAPRADSGQRFVVIPSVYFASMGVCN